MRPLTNWYDVVPGDTVMRREGHDDWYYVITDISTIPFMKGRQIELQILWSSYPSTLGEMTYYYDNEGHDKWYIP